MPDQNSININTGGGDFNVVNSVIGGTNNHHSYVENKSVWKKAEKMPSENNQSDYLNFDIEVGKKDIDGNYPVTGRYIKSTVEGLLNFPYSKDQLEQQKSKVLFAIFRKNTRRIPSIREQPIQDFGKALFKSLFVGDVLSLYDTAKSEAQKQQKSLRLRFSFLSADLQALPWELMYDERLGRNDYICISDTTSFVRHLDLPTPPRFLAVKPPLRILGMIASPKNHELDVTNEKRRIEEAVADLQKAELVELTWLQGSTWRDLQDAMLDNKDWHIFHFVGHGYFDQQAGEGQLVLCDEQGLMQPLGATKLGRLLAEKPSLRLAILNACEGAMTNDSDLFSSTAAIFIQKGFPSVLAMQYEISDDAAIEFSRTFYKALTYGKNIDSAVLASRKAINLNSDSSYEWATPVLYMRPTDGLLFQIDPTALGQSGKPLEQEYSPTTIANTNSQIEVRKLEDSTLSNLAATILIDLGAKAIEQEWLGFIDIEPILHQDKIVGLETDEVLEALEELERFSLVKLIWEIGSDLPLITLTSNGFELYCERFIQDYSELIGLISLEVANGANFNKTIAETLKQPLTLVNHILNILQNQGLIKIVESLGGGIDIWDCDGLKRLYRNFALKTPSVENETALKFIELCNRVLNKLNEAAKDLQIRSQGGTSELEIAKFIFGEDVAYFFNSAERETVLSILGQLELLGLISSRDFMRCEITNLGKIYSSDLNKLYNSVGKISVEQQHSDLLRLTNQQSLKTNGSNIWLSKFWVTDFTDGLKWSVKPTTEILHQVCEELQEKGLIMYYPTQSSALLKATYKGLLWENLIHTKS